MPQLYPYLNPLKLSSGFGINVRRRLPEPCLLVCADVKLEALFDVKAPNASGIATEITLVVSGTKNALKFGPNVTIPLKSSQFGVFVPKNLTSDLSDLIDFCKHL